jgi:hypothetical protein
MLSDVLHLALQIKKGRENRGLTPFGMSRGDRI